jgi:hypothetical protein
LWILDFLSTYWLHDGHDGTSAGLADGARGTIGISLALAHLAIGHHGALGHTAGEHIDEVFLEPHSAGDELVHVEEGAVGFLGEARALGVRGVDEGEQVLVTSQVLVGHVAAQESSVLVDSWGRRREGVSE